MGVLYSGMYERTLLSCELKEMNDRASPVLLVTDGSWCNSSAAPDCYWQVSYSGIWYGISSR